MSNKRIIIILLAASIATHFAFFGRPNETVFDEVHFGKFVSGYYTGEYYFDIHPPLGKLMIAGFAKVVDFKPEYNFTDIGKEFPDKKYLALRFLPTLAGTLLPLVIFLLALELGMSRMAAFTGGLLIVFENALLTQSRLMLLDPFLLLFGFLSLLFYFKSRHKIQNTRHKILMAIFASMAVSIKWTGLSFIALPILIESAKTLKFLKFRKTDIKQAIAYFMSVLRLAPFFFISFVIYLSVFVLHFALLPKSGPGDAFMKPGFRERSMSENIWDLNIEMYKSNQRITASHPYSSQFYAWPLMARPIYYWVKDNARIYFFGNPIIWWSSTAAVLILLWQSAKRIAYSVTKKRFALQDSQVAILLGGYFLNLLPFIGVKRVMFLYHYLTALIFAILILIYLIDGLDKLTIDKTKNQRKIFTGLIIASIIVFFYFAPLTYGLPSSDKAYEARVWFASWK